jgi:tripartite-type tricarboxylate transporter receptor subunit TctC
MAPAGVPKPILDKIAADWATALKTPEMQAKMKSQFILGHSDTPAAFDKIIASETAELTRIFKDAGIGGK